MQVQTGSRPEKSLQQLQKKLARLLPSCHYQFNKLTSVFHGFDLLLIMNFVITLSKPSRSSDSFDNAIYDEIHFQ